MNPTSTPNEFGGQRSLQHMYQFGLKATQTGCAIVTMPVEYALRPHFGTRYFDPIQMLFSFGLMLFLPLAGGMGRALPYGPSAASNGLIGLGTLSLLFFL